MEKDIEKLAAKLANGKSLAQMQSNWERRDPAQRFAQPEKTPAELAYWEKVWEGAKVSPNIWSVFYKPEKLSFEEAKKSLWQIFLQRADEIATITQKPFAWQFSEKEAENINDLLRYFLNDPAGKYPIHKGLFVFGAVGTGKTEIMQVFQRWAKAQNLQKQFVFTSLSQVYTRAKSEGDYDPVFENVLYNRLFDEFGRYTGNVLSFGNPIDINEAIIEQRYAKFQRYGQITHFVANAQPNETKAMFSPMVYDRLRSMCSSVHFEGKSKRK